MALIVRAILLAKAIATTILGFRAATVAIEVEAVGVVDEPIEDGVGIGRTADHLVPPRDR